MNDWVVPVAQDRLQLQENSQGWRQLLTGRKEILDAFDRARDQARAHEIEVYHGRVAEAAFRKWLSGFLPKRYGVTSGYVVSQGLPDSARLPHYDVIIYDRLESPVLWIEDHADSSPEGRSLAIPAEYVLAVLEVKSGCSASSVKDAITHLRDLHPLMAGVDAPDERYKLYLPSEFSCGTVFLELRSADGSDPAILDQMLDGVSLRGYRGGIILRSTSESQSLLSGRIAVQMPPVPIVAPKRQDVQLAKRAMSRTLELAPGLHWGVVVWWTEYAFAQFAFDLTAMLKGRYCPSMVSSFYGLGRSIGGQTTAE